ncbi:UNVERIFIED_CONTAM: hypothetical protein Sradi_7258200 [Sesamum radiatum]|uniref:SWIM-type domain-containing protein n=1 Tax=Sesamum radiatum TaxID=300843 RepID=A0AAW2IJM4_SESRA
MKLFRFIFICNPSNYAGPSDNAGPSSNVGQSNYAGPPSNAGTSAYNEEDDDPEGDSLMYNESSESEPDEVEEEDQMPANHENDDEVSIDIMMDVLGNNADAPTTPAGENFDLNMPTGSVPPYNLYPVPAFFRTTHPEIPADSIDVPTGNWGHFYDSNTGELALGMVFKSKEPLESKCTRFLGPTCKTRNTEWSKAIQNYGRYAGPHTCLMNEVSVDHGNLGKSMIATHLMGMVREEPNFCNQNVRQIKDKFGFEILTIRLAGFEAAREQIYGTWESSVQKLPRPCIQGFRYCRNVISVDGTHLYTRYKHKLLVAVTLDANNQVLPLAFALVDEETLASWTWFLQMLARHFLPNEDDRFESGGYDWLGNIDKTQWTLAHDGGWRTGILTTNMSEAVNGVLKGARRLPIVPLVEITLNRSAQYFLQRTARANRMVMDNQQWADYAFRLFEARQAEAIHHIVQKFDYNQQSASVITLSTTGQGSRTYVVKLRQQMCSCGKWATHGIPCSHAIRQVGISV